MEFTFNSLKLSTLKRLFLKITRVNKKMGEERMLMNAVKLASKTLKLNIVLEMDFRLSILIQR